MNEPHDPNRTLDVPSTGADSLDAGLAAGFGAPRSSLGDMRPVLLKEAEGESDHIVKPKSDAMPPPEQTGDRYQLQGEIARGGMGAVLRGRDVDLGRDLAVKVLLEKYARRPEVARRFIEEAQIGGQLQHPGVVPVYDIGRFGERPFFTMKLVKGQTLAHLLGERADYTQDRPRLLSIALQVAQTLAYAHAKGVIHRDLKPANVMVGAFGEVQVMDWGLAKVLAEGGIADEERASRGREPPEDVTQIRTARSNSSAGSFGTDTEAGSLLGTPAYMPPEQANGDIANLDRRADVFGLGAILCEILTGKPPYVGRFAEEVRRKARNGDLTDANARLDACGADAELIVLTKTCLAAEAIDRPKDAQVVADGLTAYLSGVQERLHQAELAEAEATAKAIEEAKRRRLTLALAATVLLALTLGGGGWLWVKNERDARQAQVAREVNVALNQAMALREKAKAATTGAAALFAQAREQAQRALALVDNSPADDTLQEQVRRLQNDLDEEAKDRQLIAALDEARMAQAETLSENRFALERAVPLFRKALQAYGLPAGQGDPAAVAAQLGQRPTALREAVIAAWEEWIDLATSPKHPLAEPHLDWLRAVVAAAEPADRWTWEFRAALAEPRAQKQRQALEKLAADVDVRTFTPRTLMRLAERLDDAPAGERHHPDALRPAALRLLRRAQQQYPADFWINTRLGLRLRHGRPAPADLSEAVRYLTAAVALRPDSPGAHLNLGNGLRDKGQVDEAIACHRKAIALDPKFAVAHNNLGWVLKDKGLVDEGIACVRKAIALDPNLAQAHGNLGAYLCDFKGDYDGAIASFRKAIALDSKYSAAHCNLGNALVHKGLLDEALACYRKAIELNPKFAGTHFNMANVLRDKGQFAEAIASYKKVIALDPKNAGAHRNLGAILCDRKRDYDAASACFRKAIEIDPKDAIAHFNLGIVLYRKGQVEEAIASFRKAIDLDPKYATAHYNLGNALAHKGQVDEALACYQRAIRLDPKYTEAHCNLGNALAHKGRVDEAFACYQKAIQLDPTYAEAHCNLGHVFRGQGRFAESLATLKRGHELGSKRPGWPYPSAQWVADAERLAALEARLPAFQKGEIQPRDTAERLVLIGVCEAKKLHHTATRLYTDAFTADPGLADDRRAPLRYNAACRAALAAAGQGGDATQLDNAAKAKLRGQALDWLKAELSALGKDLDSGPPPARAAITRVLSHWRNDPDLAGIRESAALGKVPAEERAAHAKLWADVAALLKKAEALDGQAAKLVGPIHEVGQGLELRGRLDERTPALVYQVKLAAGKTYVIDMVSPDQQALDPYLVLSDALGKKLAEDDDSGGGLNARIIFRPAQDGTFRIRATSFNGGRGEFSLKVREQLKKEDRR
jgi:serine/threonine-protein kinase